LKNLKIDPLTRVEGLGRVYLREREGRYEFVRLEIYEAPRFFEKLVVGKKPNQVLDIVARICGLCPVAYQITASEAFERIFEIKIPEHIYKLRRALYLGEWISSHSAHVFFLHLPDFFKKESFIELAKEKKNILEIGLYIRKTGNRVIDVIGGRHVHPVNLKVGGFYTMPEEKDVESLLKEIEVAVEKAEEALELVISLEYPEIELDYEFISLYSGELYPIVEGEIKSSKGWKIKKEDYEKFFEEYQEPHSTALYSRIKNGKFYLVGPLSRFNNNFHNLDVNIVKKLKGIYPIKNPFMSIIPRVVEILYGFREILKILTSIDLKQEPSVEWKPKEGEGLGVTEAPRGILYHKYTVDEKGKVLQAKIVPPTSQNQGIMEETLYHVLNKVKPENPLEVSEKVVRTFDPCISCATHFLNVVRLP